MIALVRCRGIRGALRRTGRTARKALAAAAGPLLTAGGMALPPVAVTTAVAAGVTAAVAVGSATQAKASTGLPVAVVLVNGESSAPEAAVLTAAGYNVTPVTPATLAGMSQSTFQGYAAVVIGDSSTSSSCSTTAPSTSSLGSQWEGWVNGNVAVLGTAPAMPGTSGANALIADAAGYAAAQPTSGSVTGLYVSLNCGYATSAAGTAVSLLNGVDGIGTAGGVTVNGSLACTDTGTVNKWEASAAATFGGFTSGSLSAGSWPSPACPVQEAFDSWPAMFTPVAYDTASDTTANFTASDGVTGQPYILLGAPISAGTPALAPGTGGAVPLGATTGGANPAAPGVTQETAGDGVNTENGDFTESAMDFSVPAFGPSLDFTRTYDTQQAQQETVSGTPGPMGYGWTDDWATSLTTGQTVPGDIYTTGGGDTWDGNGFVPANQSIWSPPAVSVFGGNTYIADADTNRVEEVAGSTETQWGISMIAGHMYTVAGDQYGHPGQSGNGTAAASILLNDPWDVVANTSGLYIADTGNCRVVEIAASTGTQWGISMTAGDMYVIAGRNANNCGLGADNTAATASDLSIPASLALGVGSHAGDLYIDDAGTSRVQEVPITSGTEWGQQMTANDIYTVAGSLSGLDGMSASGGSLASSLLESPAGLMIGGGDNLYIADTGNCRVMEAPWGSGTQWGISMTAGNLYTVAGRNGPSNCGIGDDNKSSTQSDLNAPTGVWAGNGNLYIADAGNNRVQEVAGSTHTEFAQSMTADFVYTVAGNWNAGQGFSGDGGLGSSALMDAPAGVWVDGTGDLYVADTVNNRIREVSAATSDISTIAGNGGTRLNEGDGGPALWSGLHYPTDMTADALGDVFIADSGNNRVQEVAVTTHTQFGIAMTAGDVYTVAGSAIGNPGVSGDGSPATAALLRSPESLALDPAGDLYIADTQNNRIQEVPAASGTQWGQSMTAGDTYTIAGSSTGAVGASGDGGPAAAALLAIPAAIRLDNQGNIYIADANNSRVQEIAAATGTQRGQSMTVGDIYTVAGSASGTIGYSGDGGAATSALLDIDSGIAVDPAGDLYIGDTYNNVVREVAAKTGAQWGLQMTANHIYTIAGNGSHGGTAGDGGPATAAQLSFPSGLATDAAGDLYIADESNNRIQLVPAANGTQWGQSMTAGDMYTVIGSPGGTDGTSGDGGPATSALINAPGSVTIDAEGDLFLPDSNNGKVREVLSVTGPLFKTSPAGSGITINQPGGSQVTFYPKTGTPAACTSPYVDAGSDYCTLPQNVDATLTLSSGTYTYSPSPGTNYSYNATSGALQSESDAAGDILTITPGSPAPGGSVPGNGTCPSTASSCATIMSPSGRALIVGSNSSGLVTSVTDPMDRQWTYAYNSASQLTTATDPMGNITSYTYGAGGTGNPQLASDLLTVTDPNAQPGGPDAGDATVNVYNAAGQVTRQTDPLGLQTTFDYTGFDPATGAGAVQVTDPDGNMSVDYYQEGTLAATSEWTGSSLTSEQDWGPADTAQAGGTLEDTWRADGNGNVVTTNYRSDGSIVAATDALGNKTTAWRTALEQPSCSGEPTAATPCSATESGPAPVAPGGTITPPSSAPPAGVTYILYNTAGGELYTSSGEYMPGSSTASSVQTDYALYAGNTLTLNANTISCAATPPSPSLPCATVDAAGQVTQIGYDPQGDITSTSEPDGNGSEVSTRTSAYDPDGEQTSVTTPDGNLPGANPGNYTTVTAYNADGLTTSVTQGGGAGATVTPRVTSYGYDANGNQTSVTDPRDFTSQTKYDADGSPTETVDPLGNISLNCYDGAGNLTQSVPPAGVAANGLTPASCPATYAYPSTGYGQQLASDASTVTYDGADRKMAETAPAPAGQTGDQTTTYTYDGAGNTLTTTTPPAVAGGPNQVTANAYNADEQLTSTTAGYGTTAPSTTSYCYDPDGNQTSTVQPDGNTSGTAPCESQSPWVVSAQANPAQASYQSVNTYASDGTLVSTTTPATGAAPGGTTTTYAIDSTGKVATSTDPNGVTTTSTYNSAGNLTQVTNSGSASAVSYTYDAQGQTSSMTDGTGTSNFSYDPFGELTSATNGAGQTVSYAYGVGGQLAGITYPLPSGATWAPTSTVSYGYDHDGRLSTVTDFNGNQIAITDGANGLPATQTLGSSGDTLNYSYDQTGTPSVIALENSSGTTLQSFAYTDAPDGLILAETDTPSSANSPASYTYDQQGRLASMTPGSGSALNYAFDPSGDLTTLPTGAAGQYNSAGELTQSTLSGTAASYAYDADGNRLNASQGGTTIASATWDALGQLTAYTNPAATMNSATYDGNGLRVTETATPAGGSATTQRFLWGASGQLLMDSDNAYVYTGGTTPAEQVNLATGAVSYLVHDALGSVRGIVSSTGALAATTSYDAWGNPLTPGGLTSNTPFGFAGGYTDPTGLIYLISRYYDPATGQFISVDPDVADTGQPYAYTGGDPVSEADPLGQQWSYIIKCSVCGFEDELSFQKVLANFVLEPVAPLFSAEVVQQKKTGVKACPPGAPKGSPSCRTRFTDIYWYEQFLFPPPQPTEYWGWLNELKVGGARLGRPTDQEALEVKHDKWLLDAGGGWPTKSNPIRGWNPANIDIWWFAPNLAGVSFPDPALFAAMKHNGFNIVILWEQSSAPPMEEDQPRSQRQREVEDIKSGNAKSAEAGLKALVYGCGCA